MSADWAAKRSPLFFICPDSSYTEVKGADQAKHFECCCMTPLHNNSHDKLNIHTHMKFIHDRFFMMKILALYLCFIFFGFYFSRNAIHQQVDLGLPINRLFLVRAARNHRWPGLWVVGRPRRRRRRTYTALSNPSLYYLHRHDDTTRPWKTQRMLSRVYPSLGYLPSLDKLIRRPRSDRLRPTTDTHAWSHTHGLMEI